MPRTEIEPVLEAYMEHHDICSFEGPRGVDRFTSIVRVLGYDTLQYFLEDNPGCMEAMLEWIGRQRQPDWLSSLAAEVPQAEIEDSESQPE